MQRCIAGGFFLAWISASQSAQHCSKDEGDLCDGSTSEYQASGSAMLQILRSIPEPKQTLSNADVAAVTWRLGGDGTFTASGPLAADATFQQKPDANVGCKTCDCSFVAGDGFASPCDIETNSRAAVAKYLPEDATVLEVGARHGSSSCAISAKLKHSGRMVSMDADPSVWDALDKNRISHGCNFHIARGLLGNVDGKIHQNHFGTFAVPNDATVKETNFNETIIVPHFTIDDLQREHNLEFDAAMFDCEGCFAIAIKDFPQLASQLKTLIVESHDEDEGAAVEKLTKEGWKLVDFFGRQKILKRE